MRAMIILRSNEDFPQKIEEMKVMYPSKKIAMEQIDHAIDYLRKVKHYRQYTESDEIFERQVILHLRLKQHLTEVQDWGIVETKISPFSKILTFISHWQINVLRWIGDKFPKWFTSIRNRVIIKHSELKRKNLI